MSTAYKFSSNHPALAARIASLKTTDIAVLFKQVFGITVNIMQKFPNPPKCKAAEYLVDNAPQAMLQQVIAAELPAMERNAGESKSGRPVNKYHHDPEHDNNAWSKREEAPHSEPVVTTKVIDKRNTVIVDDDVQKIVDDYKSSARNSTTTKEASKMDNVNARNDNNATNSDDAEERLAEALRDILGSRATSAPLDIDAVRVIAAEEAHKAMHGIKLPTRIEIAYREKDDSVSVRDLGLQHKLFAELLTYVRCGFPVWLPGPAGSGKTTAAMNVAIALGKNFFHNGAVDTEYKLLGFENVGGKFTETQFYLAYKFGGVYLFDEIDASNPQALVALNAALENGSCVFGNGECVKMHEDFIVIAAANTYGAGATHEYVGRTKLDAATVDRFIMLSWEYDEELERAITEARTPGYGAWVTKVQKIRASVARASGIKHVVSPRASLRGAALLAAGVPESRVLQSVVFKGLPREQVTSVMAGV